MSGVKEKANADNNSLAKEVEACAMNTALQPESFQAESRKQNKMSDDSRRMHKISWNSTTGRMKARAISAGIQKGGRATAASLGRKSSKGVELPYLELPEPEDMRNLSDTDLEIYTIKRKWYTVVQNLRRTPTANRYRMSKTTLPWAQVLEKYAEALPEEPEITNPNALAARASSCYRILAALIDVDTEESAIAEALENPEFDFPEEDEDDQDDENVENEEDVGDVAVVQNIVGHRS